jgi:hypothetical protein
VALTITVAQDWTRGSADSVSSSSISVASGDVLVAVVSGFGDPQVGGTAPVVVNGGDFTFRAEGHDITAYSGVWIFTRRYTSSTSVTVTAVHEYFGSNDPALKVYKVVGAYSSPVGAVGGGTSTGNVITPAVTLTGDSASAIFAVGRMVDTPTGGGSPTSDASSSVAGSLAAFEVGTKPISGYRLPGATGSQAVTLDGPGSTSGTWAYALVEIRENVGSTSHTASASVSESATITASATKTAVAAAAVSTTATVTASATLTRVGAASVSTTATITAAATVASSITADAAVAESATITASATRTAVAGASVSTTAAFTASATVSTPGVVTADATASIAAAVTAALAATYSAAASVSTAAAITAAASVWTPGSSTPGFMAALDVDGPTMTVSTGPTTQRMTLMSFDLATMTAVLSTDVAAPALGVPVFVGADDPVTAGLVASGVAHVWFHGSSVSVRESA